MTCFALDDDPAAVRCEPLPPEGPPAMASKLTDLSTIDSAAAALLASVGVVTTSDLLERAAAAASRAVLSRETGLGEGVLLRWAGIADLLRIKGMTPRFAELLSAAGAGTIAALRLRRADRLADAMLAVQAEKKMTRLVPSAPVIDGWIERARALEPLVDEAPASDDRARI